MSDICASDDIRILTERLNVLTPPSRLLDDSMSQPAGRTKMVHHLDTPYSTVSWPDISLDDQDAILELLCHLLSPLGHHRRAHTRPSKGKRAARGRREKVDAEGAAPASAPVPPRPELCAKVDVGFNSITRTLQEPSFDARCQPYAMVFVARGNQSSAFNCHFPKMVGVASKDCPPDERTRLVGFSKPCSDRLSSSLGIARVSSVALSRDAPGAAALWDLVRRKVAPVDMAWLEDAMSAEHRVTKIISVDTPMGSKRARTT
ncbi:hypothetical protein XA68_10530 [Ophiocordyceps unilateralis]|uniref:Uncharacterized protein n=1 Tax=Ophiocordyceps unilateralis TaxID=268505 RepID=A0A2A9PIE8_OPHUN|nr:hypothetical protein XA68_10530 [Ophiocordyceps unilateralis]